MNEKAVLCFALRSGHEDGLNGDGDQRLSCDFGLPLKTRYVHDFFLYSAVNHSIFFPSLSTSIIERSVLHRQWL